MNTFKLASILAMAAVGLAVPTTTTIQPPPPAPSNTQAASGPVNDTLPVPNASLQAPTDIYVPATYAEFLTEDVSVTKRATSLFHVVASYTDTMVNLGDLDIFYAVWGRMYAVADNNGGLSDLTKVQSRGICNSIGSKPSITTRTILDGQWGSIGGLNGWQMRDALIGSMWNTIQAIGNQNHFDVYSQCVGFTWQEGLPFNPKSACGPKSPVRCPQDKSTCQGVPYVECTNHADGHLLPSVVRINVYNADGSLRADEYTAKFSAQTSPSGGGCGKAGAIAEVLASFVPGIGTYFEKGLKIACRQGGL